MSDTANRTVKVFKEQGGDTLTVASGGEIAFESGSLLSLPVTAAASGATLTSADLCRIYTTRGASGAVTFTLPAASGNSGKWCVFWNVADQNMIVAGQDEEVVAFNDLTADSIAFQTTSEKIGGAFVAVCDGTSWLVSPLATETQTITVASA